MDLEPLDDDALRKVHLKMIRSDPAERQKVRHTIGALKEEAKETRVIAEAALDFAAKAEGNSTYMKVMIGKFLNLERRMVHAEQRIGKLEAEHGR